MKALLFDAFFFLFTYLNLDQIEEQLHLFFLIDVVLFKPQYEITQAPLSNLLSDYAVEITAKHFYLQNSCNWLNGFNRKSLVLEIKTETITLWFPHCLVFVFFCYFLISCSPQSNSLRTCLVYVAHIFFFPPFNLFIYSCFFSQSVHQSEAFCSQADIKCSVCGLRPFMTHQADKTGANRARAAADSGAWSFTAFFFSSFFFSLLNENGIKL